MRNLLRSLTALGLLITVLFGSAGRWDLPFLWAYLGLNAVLMLVGLFTVDPGLQEERWHPAPGGRDLLPMLLVGLPLFVAHLVVAGLDVGRVHWSGRVPLALQIAGLASACGGWGLVLWAMVVNRFFSPVIRVQTERGQHLITTGPYRIIRHPGYAGAIVGLLSDPLALGSWWALAPVVPLVLLAIRRTALEDRFLQEGLPGYGEYAYQVRYRLLPGVW